MLSCVPTGGGSSSPSFLSEREQIIGKLERGMYVTKFFSKKKPEKKLLAVRRETMTLVWARVITSNSSSGSLHGLGGSSGGGGGGGGNAANAQNAFEGGLDIRDIKEVRFAKWINFG